MLVLSAVVTGLGLGAMYGLLALGFHVTYSISKTVNFSQGSTMMLGAVLGFTFYVTLGWSYPISAVLAGIAGLLIAPLLNVSSGMGLVFGIKAFAASILGGLSSAWGCVLAGMLSGLIEALTTAFLGSTYTQIVAFASIILILMVAPNGLFGRAVLSKV
jgi:branched-chain amino acid transport system permease protein